MLEKVFYLSKEEYQGQMNPLELQILISISTGLDYVVLEKQLHICKYMVDKNDIYKDYIN